MGNSTLHLVTFTSSGRLRCSQTVTIVVSIVLTQAVISGNRLGRHDSAMAQSPIADVDPTTITESRTANSSEPRQQSSSPFLASQNLNDHQDQHNPSVAPQTLSSLHHQQQPTHFWNHTDGNASINPHNHVPPTQPAFPANGPPRLHAQGNHQRGPTPNGLGPGMINGMVTNHGVGMQQRASSWSGKQRSRPLSNTHAQI